MKPHRLEMATFRRNVVNSTRYVFSPGPSVATVRRSLTLAKPLTLARRGDLFECNRYDGIDFNLALLETPARTRGLIQARTLRVIAPLRPTSCRYFVNSDDNDHGDAWHRAAMRMKRSVRCLHYPKERVPLLRSQYFKKTGDIMTGYSRKIVGVAMLVLVLACATATNTSHETKFTSLPSLTAETSSSGTKVLRRVRRGVPERGVVLATPAADWHTGNSPLSRNTGCFTYHVTNGSTGAVECGVFCDDNTYYSMNCGADIFASGYDIKYVE